MPDEALPQKTAELKQRVADGATLDDLLPEAFALAREAARRTLGLRPFDVQLVGGITLHEGRIAEMRTGEGKTLVATLPAYLNALTGNGVHLVTVNDYLARRDSEWMAPVYRALGLSVGVIQSQQNSEIKRQAYAADITYGTNNEFGFDYLRDNMAFALRDRFQRGQHYAIVDEVDSILIDEARTPLIISGPAEESTDLYTKINRVAPKLKRQIGNEGDPEGVVEEGDFVVDEKNRQIELTERGHAFVEDELRRLGLLQEGDSLYAVNNLSLLHHVHAPLARACTLQTRRRLHRARQRDHHRRRTHRSRDGRADVGPKVCTRPSKRRKVSRYRTKLKRLRRRRSRTTSACIGKLSGMTGTADTEAFEFQQIYGLDVVVIPTHREMVREDHNDLVYLTIPREIRGDRRGHTRVHRSEASRARGHRVDRIVRADCPPSSSNATSRTAC